MLNRKFSKKVLTGTTALIGWGLLLPTSAFAGSCPTIISGSGLAGVSCDFDTGSSVTVSNGGQVGAIIQDGYNPGAPSFILNNGTISSVLDYGINIFNGSVISNGVTNNGTISTSDSAAIFVDSNSIISGGLINSGNIITEGIDPALILRSSILNGNLTNSGSGIIRTSGSSVAVFIYDSTVNGDLTNDGIIRSSGHSGFMLNNDVNVTGDFTNSGTITSDANNGIEIINLSTLGGNFINSGSVTGSNYGFILDGSSAINNFTNQAGATISGGAEGIHIDSTSSAAGIQNYGTITGSTYGIYISADSTVGPIDTYNGSSINGAIDAVSTNVRYNGGSINGTMNVNDFTITASNVFDMNYAITAQDAVTNAGTLALGTGLQTIAATNGYVQSTGGVLRLGVQDVSTYGQLSVDNTVDLSQSGNIDVDVVNGAKLGLGSVFSNIISGASLVGPAGGYSVTDNSRLFNFNATTNGAGVDLTAVDDASTSVSQSNAATGNSGGMSAAQRLDQIIASSPGGDWQNVIGALGILDSDQAIASAVNQIIPGLGSATADDIIKTMSTALRVVLARQGTNSGISSGEDYLTNHNYWLQTTGSQGNQDTADGITGYDSKTYGLIAGADNSINDDTRLGIGVSFFKSKLDSANDDKEANIDSYFGFAYGSYSLDDRSDVNTQIDIGYSSIDSERHINFGGLNRDAEGDYTGWDLHAGAGVDRKVKLGSKTTITPQARLDYFAVRNGSYNESGAGALNLHVDSQTQDQLIPALEVKANHALTPALSLTLHAGVGYNLLNDNGAVSASFAGGNGTFVTPGLETSPWVLRSGAGLGWNQNSGLALTANYDREDRGSEHDDQTVSLKLCMPF